MSWVHASATPEPSVEPTPVSVRAAKTRIEELAIFGAAPAFTEALHVGRPNIGDRTRLGQRIDDILDRRMLSNDGPYVREFEQRIADKLGVAHCIATCNATVALEIAIRALGMAGEVIVPSLTFIATAHALQWQHIDPVFCEVDPATHNLDPKRVEALITPRTTGIIGVHLWGRPCDVEALEAIACEHKLALLFDAAHAFDCSHRGRMIGNFGAAEVFSFHATKFLNTFEGGAVVTNDAELAARIALMKSFGFAGYDRVIDVGTNAKMSEVAAAMGLTGLESSDEFVAVNRRNHRLYREGLRSVPGLSPSLYDERETCNFQYVVYEVDAARSGLDRDALARLLWAENVMARRYFHPGCHRMEPYASRPAEQQASLPITEALSERLLSLPTGTAVTPADIETICAIVRLAVENGPQVADRLARLGPAGRP